MERTESRLESLDPVWVGGSCTCIASIVALNSAESMVAEGGSGVVMSVSEASCSLFAGMVRAWSRE